MEWVLNGTEKFQETSVASGNLERIRQPGQDWRAGRKLGERIPAPLSAAAVGAAPKAWSAPRGQLQGSRDRPSLHDIPGQR